MQRLLTIVVWLALVGFGGLGETAWGLTSAAGAQVEDRLYAAVQPAYQAEIVAATAGRRPVYTIDATLTYGDATVGEPPVTVAGTLDLRFVNATESDLGELYLRLYANDAPLADSGIALHDVVVDGAPVTPELSVDDTVVRLPLPGPVPPGGAAAVNLGFVTTIVETSEPFNLLNVAAGTGTVTLAYWYPMLAGYDPLAGWVLDPVSRLGDVVFANAALYDVALTLPANLVVAASGVEVAATELGAAVRREFVTGPVREFAAVADDDFMAVSREVAGTTIFSYANPANAAGATAALDYGERALSLFNELYGPYPYLELDLVEWPLWSCCGMELPGLVGFNGSLYEGTNPAPGELLELTVAHEVAHQWWYGLVGNNQYAHAFLDEGLASLSEVIYLERVHGAAAAQARLDSLDSSDLVVDQPTDWFPAGDVAYDTIYGKGALGFQALRLEIGDAAFFAGLRDYVARERFAVAAPADLRAALEQASARDLTATWQLWFDSPGMPPRPGLAAVA